MVALPTTHPAFSRLTQLHFNGHLTPRVEPDGDDMQAALAESAKNIVLAMGEVALKAPHLVEYHQTISVPADDPAGGQADEPDMPQERITVRLHKELMKVDEARPFTSYTAYDLKALQIRVTETAENISYVEVQLVLNDKPKWVGGTGGIKLLTFDLNGGLYCQRYTGKATLEEVLDAFTGCTSADCRQAIMADALACPELPKPARFVIEDSVSLGSMLASFARHFKAA